MVTIVEKFRPAQNMGLADRLVRFLIGSSIMAYFVLYQGMSDPTLTLEWQVAAVMLSAYPILTAMIGVDPFYSVLNVKSCNATGRNQSGSLPYQIKCMFSRDEQSSDSDVESTLTIRHEEGKVHPLHKMWHVEQEPMLYPSNAQLDAYFRAQDIKEQARNDAKMKRAA